MAEHDIDEHSGVATTGHSWDGIKELNNPLPRWWLWTFYATVAISIVWWVLMPAWPGLTGYTKGLLGYTQRNNVALEMSALENERASAMTSLAQVSSMADIENDPELLQYALAAGDSLFGDNCATCHGAGGQGFPGYPNLNDDAWIWGGELTDIQQTIQFGIRSDHGQTRFGAMQAFGRDGILSAEQISDLVEYVTSLSGGAADAEAVARAEPLFAQNCAACHGENGQGNQMLGAPNLTDPIWLYGGDKATIAESLNYGRAGMMPAWTGRLSPEQIIALSVYVHSLGGGE